MTSRFPLPGRGGRQRFVTADLFIANELFGPIRRNGNTAAVGGSSAQGVDFGNFPMPRGVNFGIKTKF